MTFLIVANLVSCAVFLFPQVTLPVLIAIEEVEKLYWSVQQSKDDARRLAAESYQPDNEGPYR